MKQKENPQGPKPRGPRIDLIGLTDKVLNRLYPYFPKIATFFNNLIVYLIVSIKLYKSGRLMIGIPDYVVSGVLLLVLAPFIFIDSLIINILSRCVCG